MPRNRSSIEREKKTAEILEAAEARLREDGYESLSIAAIARELGLAPNSIYWYFPSKDHLFVAAIRHMLELLITQKPPARGSVERQVLWFVEQLEELDPLRISLYERARWSPVVARFAEELNASSHHLVANALRGAVPDADLELAAEALLATIDGATLRGLDRQERRRVVSYALRRFTDGK